jgi:hypothetical protein
MALSPGTRIGAYEVLSLLGSGGMGEVYRARDTKLEREVAFKVLPELFVADPERVARFQREAKTLAALNHLHIGGIYGFEDTDGVRALVLELVERPTLADRIAQGPIPLDEALPIARQIAEALEAAHEAGIIHRDEAGQHQAAARWDGQGVGLRPGESTRADVGHVGQCHRVTDDYDPGDDDGRRDDPRDGGVHESRASEGTPRRQAERRVGVRRRVLRDAVGSARVQGRGCQRYARDGAQG